MSSITRSNFQKKKMRRLDYENTYRLGFVPREASVDVDGEGTGEVHGGDAEAGGERLEGPVPHFAHHLAAAAVIATCSERRPNFFPLKFPLYFSGLIPSIGSVTSEV